MRIDVLLFGPLARIAQADAITVEIDGDASVSAVMHAIGQQAPDLLPALETSRLAVNHDYASADDVLSEQDEVALIGMVSGG